MRANSVFIECIHLINLHGSVGSKNLISDFFHGRETMAGQEYPGAGAGERFGHSPSQRPAGAIYNGIFILKHHSTILSYFSEIPAACRAGFAGM
jgi:hypothetical protein